MDDQLSTLSHDYVFNYIFKKLSDTFDRYRNILPAIENVEQAIISKKNDDDPFKLTMIVVSMLKSHGEKSALIQEIFENVKIDFWHGLIPEQISQHVGKYYIDSVCN